VSNHPAYAEHVGAIHTLTREGELWNRATLWPAYEIVIAPYQGYPEDWVVAKLPKGFPVKVESIKREEGRLLIGDMPYWEEYAVVSFDHPDHPEQRIRASMGLRGGVGDLREFEKMDGFEYLSIAR
jgi:hypothetical protein